MNARAHDDDMLRLELVAERLDVSKRTVQRLIRGGQIPVFRIGHQLRVRVGDLNEWTKAQQVGL